MIDIVSTYEVRQGVVVLNKRPNVYYSSRWTGIVSQEEQTEINAMKAIAAVVDNNLQRVWEDIFMYGTAFVKDGERVDPVKVYINE